MPGHRIFLQILAAVLAASPARLAGEEKGAARPAHAAGSDASRLAFEVTFPASLRRAPITGRVYVFLAQPSSSVEPSFGPQWFSPQPFFAKDVQNWKPGDPLDIDGTADGFPTPLDTLEPRRYRIQAVARLNRDTHKIGSGEGNLFGPVVAAELDPARPRTVTLNLDRAVPPRTFTPTDRIKLAEFASPVLSSFLHRPIKHRAAVILPEGFRAGATPPGQKLPALYIIPGFGGDHFMARRIAQDERYAFGKDLIRIVLDPDCGTGHHVFADSATNGPRAIALVEEFIPYLEQNFPIVADPRARFLTGHSSGGWSSLWLQITFPDRFAGTWSTSPDPVDFRDFQGINIYALGENMYRDRAGNYRPIARMGKTPAIYYDRFSRMDDVVGWGSQLGSFEAVFSPLDRQGKPRKLWNRATGAIDPLAAKAWEKYDVNLVLERNWTKLAPTLKGKLHVITGGLDTFYLEGAVKLLKESLARLGSDATVEIIADRDHGNVLTRDLARRIDHEIHKACSDMLPARAADRDEP
jgi:hypothetical protein